MHDEMETPAGDADTRQVRRPPPRRAGAVTDDPLAVVRDVGFTIAFRGYAREEVDSFVARVSELIAELDAIRSPESAVKAALDRVGEETSGILQRARETAEDLTARSRVQAGDRIEVADREARAIRAEAEARVEELDADIEALWRERGRLIDEVRRLSEDIAAVAATAVERMPPPGSHEDERSDQPVTDTLTTTEIPVTEPPIDADDSPEALDAEEAPEAADDDTDAGLDEGMDGVHADEAEESLGDLDGDVDDPDRRG